jgi:hypothetical protein
MSTSNIKNNSDIIQNTSKKSKKERQRIIASQNSSPLSFSSNDYSNDIFETELNLDNDVKKEETTSTTMISPSPSPSLNFPLTSHNIEVLNKCFSHTNDSSQVIKLNETVFNEKNNLQNIDAISKMTSIDIINSSHESKNNLQEQVKSNATSDIIFSQQLNNNLKGYPEISSNNRVNITSETPLQKDVYRLMDRLNTFSMKLEIGETYIKIIKPNGFKSRIKRGVIGWLNVDGFFSWSLLRWKTYDEARKTLDETITTLYLCKNSQYLEERELFNLLKDAALKGINGTMENGVIKTLGLNSLKETYSEHEDFVSKISTIITTREAKLHKI